MVGKLGFCKLLLFVFNSLALEREEGREDERENYY